MKDKMPVQHESWISGEEFKFKSPTRSERRRLAGGTVRSPINTRRRTTLALGRNVGPLLVPSDEEASPRTTTIPSNNFYKKSEVTRRQLKVAGAVEVTETSKEDIAVASLTRARQVQVSPTNKASLSSEKKSRRRPSLEPSPVKAKIKKVLEKKVSNKTRISKKISGLHSSVNVSPEPLRRLRVAGTASSASTKYPKSKVSDNSHQLFSSDTTIAESLVLESGDKRTVTSAISVISLSKKVVSTNSSPEVSDSPTQSPQKPTRRTRSSMASGNRTSSAKMLEQSKKLSKASMKQRRSVKASKISARSPESSVPSPKVSNTTRTPKVSTSPVRSVRAVANRTNIVVRLTRSSKTLGNSDSLSKKSRSPASSLEALVKLVKSPEAAVSPENSHKPIESTAESYKILELTRSGETAMALTRSPKASTGSPKALAGSSKGSTRSPKASTGSPKASTRSPKASTRSPKASTRSPKASTRSPKASIRSPKASTRSPNASTRSPKASTSSPNVSARSPKATARSPKRSTASLDASTRSSKALTRSSSAATSLYQALPRSSKASAKSPNASVRSPQAKAKVPKAVTKTPKKSTRSPKKSTKTPKKLTMSDNAAKVSPKAAKVSPEASVKAPKKSTKSPKATRSPKASTKTPKKSTKSPKATTRSPKKSTKTPKKSTKTPQKSTKMPKKSTMSPKAAKVSPKVAKVSPKAVTRAPKAAKLSPNVSQRTPSTTTKSPKAVTSSLKSGNISLKLLTTKSAVINDSLASSRFSKDTKCSPASPGLSKLSSNASTSPSKISILSPSSKAHIASRSITVKSARKVSSKSIQHIRMLQSEVSMSPSKAQKSPGRRSIVKPSSSVKDLSEHIDEILEEKTGRKISSTLRNTVHLNRSMITSSLQVSPQASTSGTPVIKRSKQTKALNPDTQEFKLSLSRSPVQDKSEKHIGSLTEKKKAPASTLGRRSLPNPAIVASVAEMCVSQKRSSTTKLSTDSPKSAKVSQKAKKIVRKPTPNRVRRVSRTSKVLDYSMGDFSSLNVTPCHTQSVDPHAQDLTPETPATPALLNDTLISAADTSVDTSTEDLHEDVEEVPAASRSWCSVM